MEGEQVVLIVDDDSAVREGLECTLARAGYAVVVAADGEEALLKLEGMHVDVVVSDIRMPGMGGLEVLWECSRRWPGLPVILMTGSGSVPEAVTAIKKRSRGLSPQACGCPGNLSKIAVEFWSSPNPDPGSRPIHSADRGTRGRKKPGHAAPVQAHRTGRPDRSPPCSSGKRHRQGKSPDSCTNSATAREAPS